MPDLFSLVTKYFWFLAILISPLNFLSVRSHINQAVRQNPELQSGAPVVLVGSLLFLTVPYLGLGLVQLAGGFDSPLFFYFESLTNPFVWISFLIPPVCIGVILFWIYFREGARKMLAYGVATGSEKRLKLSFTLMPVGYVIIFFWGRFFLSSYPH